MALIKCSECGNMISDKAPACPKCGWIVDLKELEQDIAKPIVKKGDCPKCEKPIYSSSGVCGSCGYMPRNNQIAAKINQQQLDETVQRNNGVILLIGAIIVTVIIAVWVLSPSKYEEPVSKTKYTDTLHPDGSGEAYEFSKDFVLNRLKAPTTAKFAPFRDTKCFLLDDGNTWKIYSYVDSQNSFGAMIRTWFYVKMIKTYSHWKLLDIQFFNK